MYYGLAQGHSPYYHARYYDPTLARFISPDSIVPGASLSAGGALGTVGMIGQEQSSLLTVDFHEGGLLSGLNGDNALTLQKGFWFQLSGQDRRQRQAREPWGPHNPQALNRYSYVLDNPVRYVDPSGHFRWVVDEDDPLTFTVTLSFAEARSIAHAANITAALLGIVAGGATLLIGLSLAGVITAPVAAPATIVAGISALLGGVYWLTGELINWLVDLGYHLEIYCVHGKCGLRLVQISDTGLDGANFCTKHRNGTVSCTRLDDKGNGGGGGGADRILADYKAYFSICDCGTERLRYSICRYKPCSP